MSGLIENISMFEDSLSFLNLRQEIMELVTWTINPAMYIFTQKKIII